MHSFEYLIEMIISTTLIHAAKMPTYIVLVDWTDQGIRNVKDTIKRSEAFKSAIEKSGGKLLMHIIQWGNMIMWQQLNSRTMILQCLLY